MTDRVEVKTETQARKAIEAGKAIRIIAGSFTLTMANVSANVEVIAPAVPLLIFEGRSHVVAWGSSHVEAWGSSHVVARESSHVEARESSHVVAWGSSHVEAWERSHVEARGSSHVVAWGSSHVEAWESSHVEARGSSHVEARGYSMLQVKGVGVSASASQTASVNLWNGASCEGGRQQAVSLSTPQDWCEYYGVRTEEDCAIVYKAVGEGYVSYHGVPYTPGSMPKDEKWNGRGEECASGGGLNFSPTPRHTHQFVTRPKHYLECRVRLDDIVCHWNGSYPEKICAKEVVAPLIECDIDGNHLENVA